ncbi:MAG: hypothetical protein JWP97_4877 [Labilithrix sp.]|nr:hypothetical protein [Labilithrix sp.]
MSARRRLVRVLATIAATAAMVGGRAPDVQAQVAALKQGVTPTEPELAAARALFQEAYRDEQERRYAAALEKFQRVAAVKETPAVRYRIAAVLAAVGRLRESRDAFRALALARETLPPTELDIADSAADRAQALDRRIPRLVLRLDRAPPEGARVAIDGAAVSASIAPARFEVDPGEHVVTAGATTVAPFRARVVIGEGGEAPLVVVLAPRGQPAATSSSSRGRGGAALPAAAIAGGGGLLAAGIVLLVLRENDVASLEDACRDVCPEARRASLEAKRDQAELFGPLGVGLGVVGLALSGVGVYLLVRPRSAVDARAPLRSEGWRALRWAAGPVGAGAMTSLGASF